MEVLGRDTLSRPICRPVPPKSSLDLRRNYPRIFPGSDRFPGPDRLLQPSPLPLLPQLCLGLTTASQEGEDSLLEEDSDSSSDDSNDLEAEVECIRHRLRHLGTHHVVGHPFSSQYTSYVPELSSFRGQLRENSFRDGLSSRGKLGLACAPMYSADRESNVVTVNLSMCRYDIVWKCSEQMGWRITEEDACTVYWSDYSLSPERVAQLHKTCRHMNHFPAMHCITQKISLALNVGRMRKLFPGEFEYIPMTFTDHREYVQHMAERSTQREAGGPSWYIVKPNTGAMGLGITLTSAPTVRDFNNCVVQQYISRPLLIEGYKFDLRCYVLVASCTPLRLFFYRDGFVRMATEKYESPSADNHSNMCLHLTNYSINKKSAKFVADTNAEGCTGHKRNFAFLNNYLMARGYDVSTMWAGIHDSIVKTFLSIQARLGRSYRASVGDNANDNVCFEVLGFDILVDEDAKPWLVEVNHSPSWRTDTPLDLRIKKGVLLEAMALMKIRSEAVEPEPVSGAWSSSTRRRTLMQMREAHEASVMQNFVRIYPCSDGTRGQYERFQMAPGGLNP